MGIRSFVAIAGSAWLLAASPQAQTHVQPPYPLAEGEPHHRLQFSTAAARVFTVHVPPGATMLHHRHPTDHLVLVVRPGRLRNEVIGRAPIEHHTGEAGTVVAVAAGDAHRQSNLGAEPARWVGVELARPTQAFELSAWPQTPDRGGTRVWSPGQVPWRSDGSGRETVALWSDPASGERGALLRLKPGQTFARRTGAERIIPLTGVVVAGRGRSRAPLEPGVVARLPARGAVPACTGDQPCTLLSVTTRR